MERLSVPPANEVWGKVIFSQACVKNSAHKGGGVSASGPEGICQPPPPRALRDMVNKLVVRILLECILVVWI